MKAYLKRDGTKFCVVLGPTLADLDMVYVLDFECGDGNYAQLLVEHFTGRIQKLLESERRRYYERGWKDAKSKKKKHGWFPGCLKETMP